MEDSEIYLVLKDIPYLDHHNDNSSEPKYEHNEESKGGRKGYRVILKGLKYKVSWGSLKDWARKGGDVSYTNVYQKENEILATIEYTSEEERDKAIKLLDGTMFNDCRVYMEIQVKYYIF